MDWERLVGLRNRGASILWKGGMHFRTIGMKVRSPFRLTFDLGLMEVCR